MLTAVEVQSIITAAIAKAAELNVELAVAVVDDGGYLQGVLRSDGALRISSEIAVSKAYTSAIMRRPTKDIGDGTSPEVLAARRNLGLYPMSGSGGGIPIWRAGVVVGAIGVGGSKPGPDIECAEAGIAAVSQ